ncbi:MAG: FAD-binding oxidoreductase [Verrucomicrobia bacterium]|nr:MAG: FAD-binding oxidoreductase [Verrucomicrobiota bacterium]TAE88860.1 MAG: FAD-binding oxidoreductase [Verrucomicrobiota bacterium]TAF27277.1 MAG: FAD-binding oxidoreductase [Verrucomicrobiota bacterium]TAF42432.1 MAG: FAD-binding oxidoreductase [Verrucomicrobiota bacterium]
MKPSAFHSWGRLRPAIAQRETPAWRHEAQANPGPRLAIGLGRSYGDSGLLDGGTMVDTRFLDRLISFAPESGILRAEAGISLDAVLRFAVPRGWFLPTTPGTRQVSLGGAIANDIHGKNHQLVGCFGNHVPRLALLRSDAPQQECRAGDPLHAATIGGLGLTGIITWAELQLRPIRSAWLDVEWIRFHGLSEFLALSQESTTWEHSVAWIDCLSTGKQGTRGIFIRGRWSDHAELDLHRDAKLRIPFDLPGFTLNPLSIRAFNALYYRRFRGPTKHLRQHYAPFFHPLDSVHDWNRIYGKKGFYQYQCVTPTTAGTSPMEEILRLIRNANQGSFLAVLKTFGSLPSPGMLSFPTPGITLALDFPNRGAATLQLFKQLDTIVRDCGGRLYPAKDSRMSADDFQRGYQRLGEFERHLDPAFSSDFWRRMSRPTPQPRHP